MKASHHDDWTWNETKQRYEGRDGVTILRGYSHGVWEVKIPLPMKKGNYSTGFETTSLEEAMSEAYDHQWIVRALK